MASLIVFGLFLNKKEDFLKMPIVNNFNTGHHGARFKGFKDVHSHYMAIEVARKKHIGVVVSHCQINIFVALVYVSIQHLFKTSAF